MEGGERRAQDTPRAYANENAMGIFNVCHFIAEKIFIHKLGQPYIEVAVFCRNYSNIFVS